jgi:putative addiction module CopG family antidote
MTTLSVPISPNLEEFINEMVKSGRAANKADVVRRALHAMSEEEAVQTVLRAQREIAEGKGLKGDLRELMKRIK